MEITVNDVPDGQLVIAVLVGNSLFCLECKNSGDGEPYTEDDVWKLLKPGEMIYCVGCGEVLASKSQGGIYGNTA
jgi:hypothetical protein